MEGKKTFCEDWDSDKDQFLIDVRTGKTIGVLAPVISQAVLKASPGIQKWSAPGVPFKVEQFDPSGVADFAAHWSQKWQKTYPLTTTEV